MREKLIQIIGRYTPRYLGGVNVDAADSILAAFRCDGCRYWERFQTEPALGFCEADKRATRKPEHFCAYWEGK